MMIKMGMEDIDFFGVVLYEQPPRNMIGLGELAIPMIHELDTEPGDYSNPAMVVKSVNEGFEKHRELVKKHSCNPDAIGAKLLVTHRNNSEMWAAYHNEEFRSFVIKHNIRVFAFGSRGEQYSVDHITTSRDNALWELSSLEDTTDAILFHVDILTEGIDVPSMTGVMFFTTKNLTKLLQTIGRATRRFSIDRENLYRGKITPKDHKKMVKPYCWVMLPSFYKYLEGSERVKRKIKDSYNSDKVPVDSIPKNSGKVHGDGKGIPPLKMYIGEYDTTEIFHFIESVMLDEIDNLDIVEEFIKP